MKAELEKLIKQYDIAMLFATKKEGDINSIVSELNVKNQFIDNVKKIIEKENKKESAINTFCNVVNCANAIVNTFKTECRCEYIESQSGCRRLLSICKRCADKNFNNELEKLLAKKDVVVPEFKKGLSYIYFEQMCKNIQAAIVKMQPKANA